jgi:predicted flap endonuclease-1-like 5' DNA nuclease
VVFAPPPPRQLVAEIARRTAGGLTPPHDDLVRIHGIGPKIAGQLVDLGITSYRQIARLTSEEAAIVNEALGVFPGRIERDHWVSSARHMHREVYGVEP